jgi:hypothetical protein
VGFGIAHPLPVVVGDGAAHAAAQQLQRLRLTENEGKDSCLSRKARAARWLPSITGIPHPLGKVAMMPGPRVGGR